LDFIFTGPDSEDICKQIKEILTHDDGKINDSELNRKTDILNEEMKNQSIEQKTLM